MRVSSTMAASAFAAVASAENYLGFNSGSMKADNSAKFQSDFEAEMTTAQNLEGAPGTFNAVRLYTNIQAYSDSDPIEAFEAAINTKTHLLLGIWCSGTDNIDKEVTALKAGLDKYGDDLASLVIGMSIGSEDLYRVSATGIANKAGVGAGPDVIVGFIDDFKTAFKGTALESVPIGHVDTWDVWPNSTNKAVIDAVDWVGVDEYPYYENGKGNAIENAGSLFDTAYDAAVAAVGDKPVWVTETGWPYIGDTWDEAVPSVENAKTYWDEVGCRKLFGKTTTFWYNIRDSNSANEMKFAITDNLSTTPRFNLTCPTTFDTASSISSSASSSATGTASSSFSSATASGSSTSATGSASATSGSGSVSESGSASSSDSTGSSGSGSASSSDSTGSSGNAGSASTASPSATSTITTAGAGSVRFSAASGAVAALVGAAAYFM
ncbi:glycoside hydrolase family 17 protein [Xylariales sp. AK1849]|nr:glycoside hydrolase family 17 protein [Xylariales sp. AK1849]